LKIDAKAGEALYSGLKLKALSTLSSEQRDLALFTYLSKAGCKASEQDLLARVLLHWSSVGVDITKQVT